MAQRCWHSNAIPYWLARAAYTDILSLMHSLLKEPCIYLEQQNVSHG